MRKPVVERLVLKGFRSYPNADLRLENPIFLVGRNGAGKSNLLDAFAFFADAMSMPLSTVFRVRGGIGNVRLRTSGGGQPRNLAMGIVLRTEGRPPRRYRYGFEVTAEKNYGYRVVRERCSVTYLRPPYGPDGAVRVYFDRREDRIETDVEGLSVKPESSSLILPLAGGLNEFVPFVHALLLMRTYGFAPGTFREFQDPDAGLALRRDGGNAASVLQEIAGRSPEDLARIGELLEAAVPQTSGVRAVAHGTKLSLEFIQAWEKKSLRFEAHNMSDGTLRLLGILLTVFQKERPSFLGIEEPESSLHPGAVGVLLDVLANAAERSQLLVTTQSPEVLDSDLVSESNVRVVEWSRGASRLLPLGDVPQAALRSHLMGAGELLRSNQLFGGSAPTRTRNVFEDL